MRQWPERKSQIYLVFHSFLVPDLRQLFPLLRRKDIRDDVFLACQQRRLVV